MWQPAASSLFIASGIYFFDHPVITAAGVQPPQRRKLPNFRQGPQLIAVNVQPRRELPDLRRQACQLIAREVQLQQRRELPDLRDPCSPPITKRSGRLTQR
tara:strand:- start:4979 stop:5281 length:303 start_codon:yes stop_codon:yes gene_type:complete